MSRMLLLLLVGPVIACSSSTTTTPDAATAADGGVCNPKPGIYTVTVTGSLPACLKGSDGDVIPILEEIQLTGPSDGPIDGATFRDSNCHATLTGCGIASSCETEVQVDTTGYPGSVAFSAVFSDDSHFAGSLEVKYLSPQGTCNETVQITGASLF